MDRVSVSCLTLITNTPRDYAWGTPGGISRLLGLPVTTRPEAELWLGSHPASPSRSVRRDAPWRDLAEWEARSGRQLPFLLKVLSAATPLSLQAHPTEHQAHQGFEREERLGIPRDHPERNYKDPYAKPEMIVAVEDGFEALCGFREPTETIAALGLLAAFGLGPGIEPLLDRLRGRDPLREAMSWALSDDPLARRLAADLTRIGQLPSCPSDVLSRLATEYPGDPGLVVALLTNRVTLQAGQALWLPAGKIHSYLRGTGVELMGPSDNVLRGGLTRKHVDKTELANVVDFRAEKASLLVAEEPSANICAYRPRDEASGTGVGFQLVVVAGHADIRVGGPALAVCLSGGFSLSLHGASIDVPRGAAAFVDTSGLLHVRGSGRLYMALDDVAATPPHMSHATESRVRVAE